MGIEKLFEEYCPSCAKQTNFTYIGEQIIINELDEETYKELYNCDNCHSSLVKESIIKYTKVIKDERISNNGSDKKY